MADSYGKWKIKGWALSRNAFTFKYVSTIDRLHIAFPVIVSLCVARILARNLCEGRYFL